MSTFCNIIFNTDRLIYQFYVLLWCETSTFLGRYRYLFQYIFHIDDILIRTVGSGIYGSTFPKIVRRIRSRILVQEYCTCFCSLTDYELYIKVLPTSSLIDHFQKKRNTTRSNHWPIPILIFFPSKSTVLSYICCGFKTGKSKNDGEGGMWLLYTYVTILRC